MLNGCDSSEWINLHKQKAQTFKLGREVKGAGRKERKSFLYRRYIFYGKKWR